MIKIFALILILYMVNPVFAKDESQEPPLQYTLEINGREHDILLDQPVKIEGNFDNPQLVLKASLFKHFNYGYISFQYPASYNWEANIESSNEKNWILTGNDFIIMYFIIPTEVPVETFAEAMADQFGDNSTRISSTEREFGGENHKGKLLFVKVAGTDLNVEVYSLPSQTGSQFIVFQDSPPDDRAISEEGEKTLEVFSYSFKNKTITTDDD